MGGCLDELRGHVHTFVRSAPVPFCIYADLVRTGCTHSDYYESYSIR